MKLKDVSNDCFCDVLRAVVKICVSRMFVLSRDYWWKQKQFVGITNRINLPSLRISLYLYSEVHPAFIDQILQ